MTFLTRFDLEIRGLTLHGLTDPTGRILNYCTRMEKFGMLLHMMLESKDSMYLRALLFETSFFVISSCKISRLKQILEELQLPT